MSSDVDLVARNKTVQSVVSRSEFYASCLGFVAEFLAQKPNTDTESEQSYNSDDSEFNYNPGYVIEAIIKHVK